MSLFLVAFGGAIGAWLRFTIGIMLSKRFPISAKFPLPILLINFSGSFLLGISPLTYGYASFFALIGLLGGFTTFSTFSIETVALIQQKRVFAAFTYILLTVVGSILAYTLGILLVKRLI